MAKYIYVFITSFIFKGINRITKRLYSALAELTLTPICFVPEGE